MLLEECFSHSSAGLCLLSTTPTHSASACGFFFVGARSAAAISAQGYCVWQGMTGTQGQAFISNDPYMERNMKSDSMLAKNEYVTPAKKGWRGYTRKVCVTSVLSAKDGKALIKRLMPETSRAEHSELAELHVLAAIKNSKLWNQLVDRSALKTFGRPFSFGDCKISGICRDEFAEETKSLLRKYAHNGSAHHSLAVIHKMAAGHCQATALNFCRLKGL